MRWILFVLTVLMLASCASNKSATETKTKTKTKPDSTTALVEETEVIDTTKEPEPPMLTNEQQDSIMMLSAHKDRFEVQIKPGTDIAIVVRDLVTVNGVETGIKAGELLYKEPLIYLVTFDPKLISYEDMKQGLLDHPNVEDIRPSFPPPPPPIPPSTPSESPGK